MLGNRNHGEELLRIKHAPVSFAELYQRALELDHRFQEAFACTDLPARSDVETVDEFVIWARRQ